MLLDQTEEKGGHTDLGIAPGWAEFIQTAVHAPVSCATVSVWALSSHRVHIICPTSNRVHYVCVCVCAYVWTCRMLQDNSSR